MATMSKNYEFSAMLGLNYSKENIFAILNNGAKHGFIYKNCGPRDSQCDTINNAKATELIWSRLMEKYEFGPFILCKYKKTHFSLWFYNRNNKIYLCIDPDHIAWKKRYDLCAWYGINFYRYQNFMLRLIGDNLITYFQTYEYFNESYESEEKEDNNKIYVKLYTYWPYDVYHHLKVNGKILGITWLDAHKQPINLKSRANDFEDIFFTEAALPQCWYAVHHNILLKFSHTDKRTFIIQPMNIKSCDSIDQAQLLDTGLRTTIELFRNMPVFRLITFKSDEDIININKMDD